jgi:succinate dehydrogenase/fumarate reductase-like Fe-S protein
MNFHLKIWRQANPKAKGKLVDYEATEISPHTSFLWMLDIVNEELTERGEEEPIAFDSDCREGICGTCALIVNGEAHGPDHHPSAVCELYMRRFNREWHEETGLITKAMLSKYIDDLMVPIYYIAGPQGDGSRDAEDIERIRSER